MKRIPIFNRFNIPTYYISSSILIQLIKDIPVKFLYTALHSKTLKLKNKALQQKKLAHQTKISTEQDVECRAPNRANSHLTMTPMALITLDYSLLSFAVWQLHLKLKLRQLNSTKLGKRRYLFHNFSIALLHI